MIIGYTESKLIKEESVMSYKLCIICGKIPSYNHQNGSPVSKCVTPKCNNGNRWLHYKSYDEDLYNEQFKEGKSYETS